MHSRPGYLTHNPPKSNFNTYKHRMKPFVMVVFPSKAPKSKKTAKSIFPETVFTCGEADRSSRGRFVFFLLLLTKLKKLRCLWTDLTDTLVHGQGRSCLPCHQVAPKSATRGRHQSATRNDRNIFYCLRVFLSVYKTQIFSNFENRMSQT